ncbi:MAG: hypothetical protein QXU32_06930 [Nitrososphaerales archaeon]
MAWRILDSKGNSKAISDTEVEILRKARYIACNFCERHCVISIGKRARALHLHAEHAY